MVRYKLLNFLSHEIRIITVNFHRDLLEISSSVIVCYYILHTEERKHRFAEFAH